MNSTTPPNFGAGSKQWPDFYSILGSSPETDPESLRRSINTLYIKANEQSDHRELATRFYNQVLSQKVLPQCRRILLNENTRNAYNTQWLLHRDGAESALSYKDFVFEITKGSTSANALLLSDDEISILPGFSREHPSAPTPLIVATTTQMVSQSQTQPGGVIEVVEGEEVIEVQPSPADSVSNAAAIRVAIALPTAPNRKSGLPLVSIVAGLVVLGIGGFIWNSSRSGGESNPNPNSSALQSATTTQAAPEPAPDSKAASKPFNNAVMRLDSLALNSDFESGNVLPWVVTAKINRPPYIEPQSNAKSGNSVLTFWGSTAIEGTARQTIKNLKPGKYTFQAWARRGGGHERAEMFAENYGGPARIETLSVQRTWVLNSIRDIEVKNGQCTIGWSVKGQGGKYCNVDAIEFFRQKS